MCIYIYIYVYGIVVLCESTSNLLVSHFETMIAKYIPETKDLHRLRPYGSCASVKACHSWMSKGSDNSAIFGRNKLTVFELLLSPKCKELHLVATVFFFFFFSRVLDIQISRRRISCWSLSVPNNIGLHSAAPRLCGSEAPQPAAGGVDPQDGAGLLP